MPPAERMCLEIDQLIAEIDETISRQLDAILKHPRLRRLEGTWRGLLYLTQVKDEDERVKIRLLNVSWLEICRDIERSGAFDHTQLFQKVYEQ